LPTRAANANFNSFFDFFRRTLMKRYRAAATLLAILLAIATAAQAQTHKKPAPKPKAQAGDKPTNGAPFEWKHYGADKAVPDEYIPTPSDENSGDITQITHILMETAGYKKATEIVKQELAGVVFGDVTMPLPQTFWEQLKAQVGNGLVLQQCVLNGDVVGNYPLAYGSKADSTGKPVMWLRRPYAINKTGITICGWTTKDAIQITEGPHSGDWVHPIIYQQCRNVSAFKGTAPVVPTAPPPAPAPVVEQPAPPPPPPAIAPGSIASATAKVVIEDKRERPHREYVDEHHGHKGLIAGLIIGGLAGTAVCLVVRHHNAEMSNQVTTPPETFKIPLPLPPRP
jgi:hypothetical protein